MLTNELLERLKVFGGNRFCVERREVTVAELIGTILAERATLAQRDQRIKELEIESIKIESCWDDEDRARELITRIQKLEAQFATAKQVGAAEEFERLANDWEAEAKQVELTRHTLDLVRANFLRAYASRLRSRAAALRGEVEK